MNAAPKAFGDCACISNKPMMTGATNEVFMPVQLTGAVHDYYDFKDGGIDEDELREGDVLIQPKLDAAGRYAAQGRHANLGYSGYYAGFLYADGGARRFLQWKDLWPIAENTFAAQQDKPQAVRDIATTVARLAGSVMVKANGGWCLERDVNAILGRHPVD
ncbi:hypothetical protein [Paenirhodobacter sp.]|uniref:hypothetical protein n=1 Tax=Paenirhodobacter sp. TaxID=1965326 RepID=UPI003B404646